MVQASRSVTVEIEGTTVVQDTWSEDDKNMAIVMYRDQKKSMGVIGAHFKKTRGSIAGLINRARKNKLIPPAKKSPRLPEHKLIAVLPWIKTDPASITLNKKITEPTRRVRLRLIESDSEVTMLELKGHHCRWPFGDPKQSDFRFCGCTKIEGKSYCVKHVKMAVTKSYTPLYKAGFAR